MTNLFSLKGSLGNKEREICVFDADGLDFRVEEIAHQLPNAIGPGTKNVAAADLQEMRRSNT